MAKTQTDESTESKEDSVELTQPSSGSSKKALPEMKEEKTPGGCAGFFACCAKLEKVVEPILPLLAMILTSMATKAAKDSGTMDDETVAAIGTSLTTLGNTATKSLSKGADHVIKAGGDIHKVIKDAGGASAIAQGALSEVLKASDPLVKVGAKIATKEVISKGGEFIKGIDGLNEKQQKDILKAFEKSVTKTGQATLDTLGNVEHAAAAHLLIAAGTNKDALKAFKKAGASMGLVAVELAKAEATNAIKNKVSDQELGEALAASATKAIEEAAKPLAQDANPENQPEPVDPPPALEEVAILADDGLAG
jgi:hypothetical protein